MRRDRIPSASFQVRINKKKKKKKRKFEGDSSPTIIPRPLFYCLKSKVEEIRETRIHHQEEEVKHHHPPHPATPISNSFFINKQISQI